MAKRTQPLPSTRILHGPQAASDNRPSGTLTIQAAAERLGLTSAGVHAHIRRGDLKAQKLRGNDGRWHWYIEERDFDALGEHLRQFHGTKSAADKAKEAEYDRINQARYTDLINAALATLGCQQQPEETLSRVQRAECVVLVLEAAAQQLDPKVQPLGTRKRARLVKELLALQDGFDLIQQL